MRDENPYCETQRTFGECEKSKEIVNPEEKCLSSHFIDLTRDYGFKIVMADDMSFKPICTNNCNFPCK